MAGKRFMSFSLAVLLLLAMMISGYAIQEKDDITEYQVPVACSTPEFKKLSVVESEGKYYTSLQEIAALTRCEYQSEGDTVTLTQGTREMHFDLSTSQYNDSDYYGSGPFDLMEYNGSVYAECAPLLSYLGAELSVEESTGTLIVQMPEYTFWEAFMPDYLKYHFNTEEWMGSERDVEISLACDIIMDVLDITNGHGLYSTDEHFEDALYDILDVDMLSYQGAQEEAETSAARINRFLSSDAFSSAFSQSAELGATLFEGYADYWMTGRIAAENVKQQAAYLSGNYKAASDIGHQVNQDVCKQLDLQNMGKQAISAASLALQTGYNVYKGLCYDQDSRTLFSSCLTDEVADYTEWRDDYLMEITGKISDSLSTDQSIVKDRIVSTASEWAVGEVMGKGAEMAVSGFPGGGIILLGVKLGTLLAEIPMRDSFNAYSDDMDMFWLATVQTDTLELATRAMLKALKEEKGTDPAHMELVRKLMALYYRTTIAYCENAKVSVDAFGGKNKEDVVRYLDAVANYMAAYLYRMTNCKVEAVRPLGTYSDNIFNSDWIEQWKCSSASWIEAYRVFVTSTEYYNTENYMDGEEQSFAIYDISADGVPELLITNGNAPRASATTYVYSYQNEKIQLSGYLENYLSSVYPVRDASSRGLVATHVWNGIKTYYYHDFANGALNTEVVMTSSMMETPPEYEIQTENEALFQTCVNMFSASTDLAPIASFTMQEINAMGWDAFIKTNT